jgi:hypothetical protein
MVAPAMVEHVDTMLTPCPQHLSTPLGCPQCPCRTWLSVLKSVSLGLLSRGLLSLPYSLRSLTAQHQLALPPGAAVLRRTCS